MPKGIPEDRTLVPPPKEEKLLKQLEERKDYTVNPPVIVPNITITEPED